MRIIKELVFSRVKAYNLIQMFHFITETMERYYQSKLLSVAHSRVDRFISLRFQGLHARAYSKEAIKQLTKSQYSVPSKTERGVIYHVDMEIGICTCPQGQDGSPCSHQAAVVINFGSPSINCIPTMDPEGKRKLAYIAYGEDAIQDLSFYNTLSQGKCTSQEEIHKGSDSKTFELPDFSSSCWDHIRHGSTSDIDDNTTSNSPLEDNREELCEKVDAIASDIKQRLMADDQFKLSAEKFTKTYQVLSNKPSNAHLISAFHKFGWCFGGTVTTRQGGVLRRGRRIPIQAKSAGRRRKTISRGKAVAIQGRAPAGALCKQRSASQDKYFLPIKQHNSSIKRPHSLKENIAKGQQNAGKW